MRKLFIQIAVVLVVVFAVYIALFQRERFFGMVRTGVQQAKGFVPGKTPQEAVDGFRKAVASREYVDAAEVYLGGDYAEQMRKGGVAARELGIAVDNLLDKMEIKGFDSDKIRFVLAFMEPFPKDFAVPEIKKQGEDKAIARFIEGEKRFNFKGDPSWNVAQWDLSFYRALCGGPVQLMVDAELRAEGKDRVWKIYFPLPPAVRLGTDRLVKKYKTYVKVLEKLKSDVLNEPMTKADLESRFRTELETAAKD